jgi:hypothetical protein
MLQRIQTLFLIAIALLMLTTLFVNIWDKKSIDGTEQVSLNAMKMIKYQNGQIVAETTTIWIALLALIGFYVSVLSIFSFKNRMRQMQYGLANGLVIATIVGLIVFYSMKGDGMISSSEKGSFGAGLLTPALALICNSLANRFIRKDEDAVRDADRLR